MALGTLFFSEFDRAIVSKDFEHYSVLRNDLELLFEVILVCVSPTINVVRLDFDHEGPVGVLHFLTKLIELSKLHNG